MPVKISREHYDSSGLFWMKTKGILGYLLISMPRAPLQALVERTISTSLCRAAPPPPGETVKWLFTYGSHG